MQTWIIKIGGKWLISMEKFICCVMKIKSLITKYQLGNYYTKLEKLRCIWPGDFSLDHLKFGKITVYLTSDIKRKH